MATWSGWPIALTVIAASLLSVPAATRAGRDGAQTPVDLERDFDIRDTRLPAAARVAGDGPSRPRLNRDTGTVRSLDRPAIALDAARARRGGVAGIGALAAHLGLKPADLAALELVRDFTSRSTGIRHIVFRQTADGIAVFDSTLGLHFRRDGRLLRVTSNASSLEGRIAAPSLTAAVAREEAVRHATGVAGPAALAWLPVDGGLRLAWHTVVADGPERVRDVLVDAHTGELLLRRSRARDAQAIGRVLQSAESAAAAPRQPDAVPSGAGATCLPPANYELRALDVPFRDTTTVVASTGRLEGNNTRVFRGNGGQAAQGSPASDGWRFDFPFNSAASAETALFFASNFVHDFFYDLGFDEAAGNFQQNNFARGGVGGDPLKLNARAAGRNNATYLHALEGTSPTINMFLWDGAGCWAADVNGDGTPDLDAGYDLDVLVHEFHHGVSLRLNTAFTGPEAGAIGEGGGDFFAYSVNGNPTLAEYARPGGLRSVNGKTYGDWSCLLGLFCDVHDNGEIWANVLWDARERFRADAVGGSAAAAAHEVHQLYVDALTLSPPAPTMLDLRDAMLLADAARNPDGPASSEHLCRLWESFAGRGMGISALDTADNGLNRVSAAYDVPPGCVPPPAPPVVTIVATAAAASESPAAAGSVSVRRDLPASRPLTVSILAGGSAIAGSDYTTLPLAVTIPAGASEVTLTIAPIDDSLVEGPETVSVLVRPGAGYNVGSPSTASVTITSEDVAADLQVTSLTVPARAAAGATISIGDTTRNQGSGAAPASITRFFLSKDALLDAADLVLDARAIEPLAVGAASAGATLVALPLSLAPGSYFVFAKADAQSQIVELNEANNTRPATLKSGPDLVVATLTVPSRAASGGTLSVGDTIRNDGSGTAAGSVTAFYVSANFLLDGGDIRLAQTRAVPALNDGASSSGTTVVTLPELPPGSWFLLAAADDGAAVAEASETNNVVFARVAIGPDLTVQAATAPATAAPGTTIAVTTMVRNSGAAFAGASQIRFYLSANVTFGAGDLPLEATQAVPGLEPDASAGATTQVTMPAGLTGSFYLLVVADGGQSVAEANETNNVGARALQLLNR
jgi:subtilase family serine protease